MNKSINKPLAALLAIVTLSLCAGGTYLAAQSPIPAKEITVKSATEEKTYESYWIRNFQVRATTPTDGTFYIELLPYNATTGEIDQTSTIEYKGDLWDLIGAKASAAQAMGAVNAAIPDVEDYALAKQVGVAAE